MHWLPRSLTLWICSPSSSSPPTRASSCQLLLTEPSPVSSFSLLWVLIIGLWHVSPSALDPSSLEGVSLTPGYAVDPWRSGPRSCPAPVPVYPVWGLEIGTWWMWVELSLCMWVCRVGCGCAFFVLCSISSNYLAESSFGWNENLFAFFLFFGNMCALLCLPDR